MAARCKIKFKPWSPLSDNNTEKTNDPVANIIGPNVITYPKAEFIMSDPGIGRFILFNKQYFCAQYIKINPIIEITGIIGCKGAKKHVIKKRFVT